MGRIDGGGQVDGADRAVIGGRTYVSRREIARLTGVDERHQRNLYVARADNGHPEGVKRGRALYFDEEHSLAWYRRFAEAKRAGLTEMDRSGDPDELVDTVGATRILGYTNTSTIRAFLARNDGYFPEPDWHEVLPSGRTRRWWRRRTIWRFGEDRTGRGPGRGEQPREARAASGERSADR